MPHAIPTTMQALVLHSYADGYAAMTVAERPVPTPGPDQVLVRIAAAPVNPADLSFTRGEYGIRKPLPTIPGFEGSGTVVAAGPGEQALHLLGRRVACFAVGDGTWAQFMVTPASQCFPLPPTIDDEQGAMLLINPLTAWALVNLAREMGSPALVQTAAASAVGRMVLRLADRQGLPVINIVRRPEQVELLRSLGARHVLDSSAPDFPQALKSLARELNARLAVDAVAGPLTGALLAALPRGGRVTIYGALDTTPAPLLAGHLIFEGKSLDGFWLSTWLPRQTPERLAEMQRSVHDLLVESGAAAIAERPALHEAVGAITRYAREMTRGKVLIKP